MPDTPHAERAAGQTDGPARLSLALVTIAAVAFGAGAWWLVGNRMLLSESAAVAVFPFAVNGNDELAHLGPSVVDLLTRDLIDGGDAHPVAAAVVLRATDGHEPHDAAEARTIARRIGASQFVVGSINDNGGQLRIDAMLFSLRDSTRARAESHVYGDTAHLPELIHELKRALLAGQPRGVLRVRN